jgi:hypothetical protein
LYEIVPFLGISSPVIEAPASPYDRHPHLPAAS